MIITDVKVSKKADYYDIYVDGALWEKVPAQTVLDYRIINKGNEVSESQLNEIIQDSERAGAYSDALKYVAKSMRTVREVRDKLTRLEYHTSAIDFAIDKITTYGYLNDLDYAIKYVDNYKDCKGKYRIRQELIIKGVSEQYIDEALREVDESEACRLEAERYATRNGMTRDKLYRHLLVRGYSPATISQVIGEVQDL